MTEEESRERVLEIARSWIGTPFHDCACVRGAGVDCAMLLKAVYTEAGLIEDFDPGSYSPQWFLHRGEEVFMNTVISRSRALESPDLARPGDVVLYRIGRCYAHGAIVEQWPSSIIHAHKLSGYVVRCSYDDADLRGRSIRAFSLW